jgi:phenylpropionate dioxygenase-like ring-hydroxylating dioxygenase large terminal subunit
MLGTPLVLFRSSGRVGALLDRCPHRNVPLSLGRVRSNGLLECRYHGWQFDSSGQCRHIPGLIAREDDQHRAATRFAVREQDGLIWVYAIPDVEPARAPFAMPRATASGYATVVREVEAEATLHAVLENALDVPHTAYLHRGLFRGGKKNRIEAQVRRYADRVEIQYLGEPRPSGVVGRLLSPSGGTVEHWDRFFLPSIAQVEYRLGTENHFIVTSACTPVEDFRTKLFAVVSFRTRLPAAMVKPILEPVATRIFHQDAEILREQTKNIRRFAGEQFMSTEIDLMGPHIWRLLRQAERADGSTGSELLEEQSVTFEA